MFPFALRPENHPEMSTEVLDVTRGDFRTAQRFGRLAKADTLKHYDDNREDLGGGAARMIAP